MIGEDSLALFVLVTAGERVEDRLEVSVEAGTALAASMAETLK